MSTTPVLSLPLWPTGSTQPQIDHNDALAIIDLYMAGGVKSRTTTAQPGSPAAGDAYIIASTHTGTDWAAFTPNNVAYYIGGVWAEYTPIGRCRFWVDDDTELVGWNGSAWVVLNQDLSAYVQTTDIDTLTELNAILTDATLISQALIEGDIDTLAELNAILTDATIDAIATKKSKLDATAAPTATDDGVAGYEVGSVWVDLTNDAFYICVDSTTSAAVWSGGSGGGGGMTVTAVKTANYTASENEVVPFDTSGGAFTITMPASASAQSRVVLLDVGKYAGTNNLTVARNGATFDGVAEDFIIDQDSGRMDASSDGSNDWSTHLIGTPELVNVADYVTGKKQLYIGAEQFYASSVAAGTGALTSYLFNTSETMRGWALAYNAFERCVATFVLPKSWDGGAFNVYVHWSNAGTSTNNFNHAISLAGSSDNGAFAALVTIGYQNDAHGGAAYDQNKSPALTVSAANVATAGITAENVTLLEVINHGSSTTITSDIIVLGVTIEYTTNAATDD